MTKKNYHKRKVKKLFRELNIMSEKNMEKDLVINQDYLKKHHDRKETFNTFLLKLQWHERSCPGCLSFTTIWCTGAGATRRTTRRKKTKARDTEFVRELKQVVLTNLRTWKGEQWKDGKRQSILKRAGETAISDKINWRKKQVQWEKYCMMIKRSIYQKAVTSKYIYTSNIRYLRKMKQTLNWHVQITLPKKSRKHMYLKDTENILCERPR